MTHVVLSVGSNIEREKNTRYAIDHITAKYGQLEISPIYETSSVGFDGPPFYNLIVGFHSGDGLPEIIETLREIEYGAGRIRGPKSFASRILDIDVVLYGDQNFRDDGVNVPRDEIEKYAYVLKPLANIYPDMIHPLLGISFHELWQNFDLKDQTIFMARFSC
jgi:2-amino-4-hydroxy-6-hydroxymethyldihydropteridine diphosphokinase